MSRRTIDREYAEHECDEVCQDILARDRAELRDRGLLSDRNRFARGQRVEEERFETRRNRHRDLGTRISGQECDVERNECACQRERDFDECHEWLTRGRWNSCDWNRCNRCDWNNRWRCNRCERERNRDCQRNHETCNNREECCEFERNDRCRCGNNRWNRGWNRGCMGWRRGVNCDRNRRFRNCRCFDEF